MFQSTTHFYYSRLTDGEKKAYEQLAAGFSRFETNVPISTNTDQSVINNMQKILNYVLLDNPLFFYVGKTNISLQQTMTSMYLSLQFDYTKDEVKQFNSQINAKIQEFINVYIKLNMNQLAIQREIYKHLQRDAKYDFNGHKKINKDNHSIIGAFIRGTAVCEGYAKAYKLLCDHLKIPCIVVMGESTSDMSRGPHTWNISRIDGVMAHCDLTWDAMYEFRSFNYFNLCDTEISKDHTYDTSLYPKCPPNKINYFNLNGMIASNENEFKDLIEKYTGKESFSIKALFPIKQNQFVIPNYKWLFNPTQNVVGYLKV